MPESTASEPGISRIYTAFDPASHAVFRSAMALSRGGVVRVDDLLLALVEHVPEAAACLGGRPLRTASGPDLVPMANEPALRELLVRAFRLAGDGPLTPSHLLDAVTSTRTSPLPARRSPPPP